MSDIAVLVVDMMNRYQHPDAEALISNVGKIIDPLSDLVRRAHESADVDLIYVNDNFGERTAQFADIVESACNGERPDLVEPIVPTEGSRRRTASVSASRWGRYPATEMGSTGGKDLRAPAAGTAYSHWRARS